MTKRQPGWDQIEIKRVTDEYFEGNRLNLAKEIGAKTSDKNWHLKISEKICHEFGSIEAFSLCYPPKIENIWSNDKSVYITSFWGWSPEQWGCVGFANEGRRQTYITGTTDPFIMAIFVTENAPTEQVELKGKIVGFYEVSHEAGHRHQFTHLSKHSIAPEKWPYSLRAIRAFNFLPEYQLDIRDLIPNYNAGIAQTIGKDGRKLSSDQIQKIKSIPFEESPVFGSNSVVNGGIIISQTKGKVRAGTLNRSGYFIPPEPLNTPKELYILKLEGNMSAFLGRPNEDKVIYKIGLSMSPQTRLKHFQKSMPLGAFNWNIARSTRNDIGKPYPNYEIALAGEEAMKDYLALHADWCGGEFYAATKEVIDKAWEKGMTASYAKKETRE